MGKDLTLNQTIFETSIMSESKRSSHVVSGFLMGIGVGIVILGFAVWFLTNSFLNTFISWAEEHGYTLTASGFALMNQIPFLSTIIIVLGFVGLLLGVIIEMRIKSEAQTPPPP